MTDILESLLPYGDEWEREQVERIYGEEPYYGDARRCPRHPLSKTSSDDGMFDGLCGECEVEMDGDE